MEKIKLGVKRIKEDTAEMLLNLRRGNFPKPTKIDEAFFGVAAAVTTFIYSAMPAFADSGIFDSINTIITDNYPKLVGCIVGIGMLLATIALLAWMFWPSDRGSGTGKSWFVKIIGCVVVLLFLSVIFTSIIKIAQENNASQSIGDIISSASN